MLRIGQQSLRDRWLARVTADVSELPSAEPRANTTGFGRLPAFGHVQASLHDAYFGRRSNPAVPAGVTTFRWFPLFLAGLGHTATTGGPRCGQPMDGAYAREKVTRYANVAV